ncbi:MAG: hypothetical protein AB4368_07055 [Xenococcaceae cyanobacterium]
MGVTGAGVTGAGVTGAGVTGAGVTGAGVTGAGDLVPLECIKLDFSDSLLDLGQYSE